MSVMSWSIFSLRSASTTGSRSGVRETSSTSAGAGTGRRMWSMQRLCAMRYSQARRVIGRSLPRSALYALRKTSCVASSASELEPPSIRRV